MNHWEDMERRIRARGVRVHERLALLALLREGGEQRRVLDERRDELLEKVRDAAKRVREALG